MSEENKPNAAGPQDENKAKIVPDFVLTDKYHVGANSNLTLPAAKTQKRILNELLPRRKEAYSLPEWYMERKKEDEEDLLYVLCGVLHPAEGEMMFHYVERWQKDLIDQKRKDFLGDDDDDDDGPKAISVPRANIRNFLSDPERADFMFENHENLLLRLSAVRGLMNQLADALYIEGVRQDKSEWESAMDELVGQYEFPEKASAPQGELACWVWMNKMVAPIKNNLWHLNLDGTRSALDDFNWFRINKCFADFWDFADNPECTQRVNGKLDKVQLKWMTAKILMTTGFLIKNGFLEQKELARVAAMSKEERAQHEKHLKRYVVSEFVADLCKSSPDNETLQKMLRGFIRYFRPILRETGIPSLSEVLTAHRNKRGEIKLDGIINVAFFSTKEKRAQAAAQAAQKKPETPTQKPTNRPDSGASR